MNAQEHTMQMVNKLAFENGRLRFLMGEAITAMIHAERFLYSHEKMRPEKREQWIELLDRMQVLIESPDKIAQY